jgi:hypothetical protein
MNRLYLQQANSSNCVRAYNIVQDKPAITLKAVANYASGTASQINILASDIVGGIISMTGAATLTFATGSQLLQKMLPSSLSYDSVNNTITGASGFGITPNLQSLSTGATISCKFLNAGGGTISYAAGDSSYDISGIAPTTQATLTNRNLDFVLSQVNPSVVFKVIG